MKKLDGLDVLAIGLPACAFSVFIIASIILGGTYTLSCILGFVCAALILALSLAVPKSWKLLTVLAVVSGIAVFLPTTPNQLYVASLFVFSMSTFSASYLRLAK